MFAAVILQSVISHLTHAYYSLLSKSQHIAIIPPRTLYNQNMSNSLSLSEADQLTFICHVSLAYNVTELEGYIRAVSLYNLCAELW